jgi:hypothetical protein
MTGLTYDRRWSYNTWKKVLIKFKDNMVQQQGLIELLKTTTQNEYGSDKIVPYGQLIDLYYWTPRNSVCPE